MWSDLAALHMQVDLLIPEAERFSAAAELFQRHSELIDVKPCAGFLVDRGEDNVIELRYQEKTPAILQTQSIRITPVCKSRTDL